jgi:hypothetical protein
MLRNVLLGLLLIVQALTLAGCLSPPAAVQPVGTKAIELAAAKPYHEAGVALHTLIQLTLPSLPAAYVWQISFHDPRYLKMTAPLTPPAQPDGGTTASFLALMPGRTRLRFLAVPSPGSRVMDPIAQQELVLMIE